GTPRPASTSTTRSSSDWRAATSCAACGRPRARCGCSRRASFPAPSSRAARRSPVARLGVDATSVAPEGKGISRVQRHTVEALRALGRHELVVFSRHPEELVAQSHKVSWKPALAWEQVGMRRVYRRYRLDALLTWSERLPLLGGGRFLVWLFEPPTHRIRQNRAAGAGLYQRASDLVTLALWKRSLRRAAHVFAGSDATRRALDVPATTLYPGLDPRFSPRVSGSEPQSRFVLYIASRDPREDTD